MKNIFVINYYGNWARTFQCAPRATSEIFFKFEYFYAYGQWAPYTTGAFAWLNAYFSELFYKQNKFYHKYKKR